MMSVEENELNGTVIHISMIVGCALTWVTVTGTVYRNWVRVSNLCTSHVSEIFCYMNLKN